MQGVIWLVEAPSAPPPHSAARSSSTTSKKAEKTTTAASPLSSSASPTTARRSCDLRTLSFQYPLRLMSPSPHRSNPSHRDVYVLSYGGGLVAGDRVALSVRLDGRCSLSLLTQGSTKVFRTRTPVVSTTTPPQTTTKTQTGTAMTPPLTPPPPATTADAAALKPPPPPPPPTAQFIKARVGAGALLCVLPDPVTLFADAYFVQRQRYTLAPRGASVVCLDWYTSGRRSRGEEWDFEAYESAIKIDVEVEPVAVEAKEEEEEEEEGGDGDDDDGEEDDSDDNEKTSRSPAAPPPPPPPPVQIFRDVLLLRDDPDDDDAADTATTAATTANPNSTTGPDSPRRRRLRSYAPRMLGFHCFATLVLVGPRAARLARNAWAAFTSQPRVGDRHGGDGGRRPPPSSSSTTTTGLMWSVSLVTTAPAATAGWPELDDDDDDDDNNGGNALPEGVYGVVVRAAALDTDTMRAFLRDRLAGLEDEVGFNLFSRAV
ncbi:UreD urease accessory protein-domain-containing protein [Zopfochytrium polystomum]|nr:UreD urease accessory protein-domain-containing protein [Zopfochytrium polystomum]